MFQFCFSFETSAQTTLSFAHPLLSTTLMSLVFFSTFLYRLLVVALL